VRHELLAELETLTFSEQPERFGAYNVFQRFSAIETFDATSACARFASHTAHTLNDWFQSGTYDVLAQPLVFTDLVANRYPPGEMGISPHRDGKSFINIIAVAVLEGKGRFCFCDDRDGTNPREVIHQPGDIILMRGVGFNGRNFQPFHFVDQITARRTTFGMRQRYKER
jgi:alkylated DNA repair dioxygenase AlkB